MRKFLVGLAVLLILAGVWIFEGDLPAEEVDAKYANAASQFLLMPDGARIHYRDEGNANGLPLVLIHGSNSSLHTWEPWVQELGDDYRIVSLDLPGHGLTGRTPADDYTSATYVDIVQGLVAHLDIEQFVLGGNSMGGGVTWRYALRHPDQLQALLLVNASGLPSWRQRATQQDQQDAPRPLAFTLLRKPWFQSVARYIDPYFLVKQGLRSSHFDPDFVDDALIQRYYDLSMREGTRDATLKRFSSWRDPADESLSLADVQQPSLVMWGAEDSVIPVSVARLFEAELPNNQVVVYPQVGHIPMEEIPAQSAADVRAFLQSIQPQG